MSDLPSGWSLANLEQIARSSGGGTPSKTNSAYWVGGHIPWVSPKDMKIFVIRSSEDKVTGKALDRLTIVPPDSVLLVVRSGILSRTLPVAITGVPVTVNQDMRAFTPENGVSTKYVAWQLIAREHQLLNECSKHGTTVASMEGPALARFPLSIAPVIEQVRIVEKLEELLSDLDAGVAELKAAQKKLGQYRQALLKAAVEGALTAEWRKQRRTPSPQPLAPEGGGAKTVGTAAPSPLSPCGRGVGGEGETGAQLLDRILTERRARWEAKQLARFKEQRKAPPKDWQKKYPEPVKPDASELPELPEGWVWATIDQLSFVVRGASPRPAGDPRYFGGVIPWITVGSLTAGENMYLTDVDQFVTEAGKNASRFIEPDTLLLTNSGATLGVPKITKIGGCINDGSVALLDTDATMKVYLYWYLSTQTKKLRTLNQGAAQPNLNTDIVRRICVSISCIDELAEINRIVDTAVHSARQQEEAIEQSLNQSAAQRKNLLKAAFSGQLVPQDPNDEPASVLLERIRAERAERGTAKKPRGRRPKEGA